MYMYYNKPGDRVTMGTVLFRCDHCIELLCIELLCVKGTLVLWQSFCQFLYSCMICFRNELFVLETRTNYSYCQYFV